MNSNNLDNFMQKLSIEEHKKQLLAKNTIDLVETIVSDCRKIKIEGHEILESGKLKGEILKKGEILFTRVPKEDTISLQGRKFIIAYTNLKKEGTMDSIYDNKENYEDVKLSFFDDIVIIPIVKNVSNKVNEWPKVVEEKYIMQKKDNNFDYDCRVVLLPVNQKLINNINMNVIEEISEEEAVKNYFKAKEIISDRIIKRDIVEMEKQLPNFLNIKENPLHEGSSYKNYFKSNYQFLRKKIKESSLNDKELFNYLNELNIVCKNTLHKSYKLNVRYTGLHENDFINALKANFSIMRNRNYKKYIQRKLSIDAIKNRNYIFILDNLKNYHCESLCNDNVNKEEMTEEIKELINQSVPGVFIYYESLLNEHDNNIIFSNVDIKIYL